MATFGSRIRSALNAFTRTADDPSQQPDTQDQSPFVMGGSFGGRPDRTRLRFNNERTIISAIYTRLSIDAAAIELRHTRHDDNDRYQEDISSGLNDCLTTEANIDQAARAFKQDIFLTLFDKGVAAIVPVDTTLDPTVTGSFDIKTMRVGHVVQWYPRHVRVSVYNDNTGRREEITLRKEIVSIVENPFYQVMNEPNSTLRRLTYKLSLLDIVDDATSSGKMDLIIQLPYVVKSEARRQQAEQRRTDIEFQLKSSKYGIAYVDGTEKVTQLNRPVENNLLEQITTLIAQLYVELGLTPEVMNGTANEATMLNYMNRTIEPLVTAVVEAMKRTFLTKTARTQMQTIDFFTDPFKLLPIAQIAEIADKLARNEILTSNEIRGKLGFKPSSDPKADQLINSNMPVGKTGVGDIPTTDTTDATAPTDTSATDQTTPDTQSIMSSSFDSIDSAIDSAFSGLGLDSGGTTDAAS